MLEFFNNKDLTKIKSDEMKYYLAWYKENRGVSNTTLEGMRVVFCVLFDWMVNNDYIDKSPMRTVLPIKKDTMPERELTDSEIEKFKNACKSIRDRAIIEFLYSTGCRITEMCETKLSDVNWEKSEVYIIGKGNKPRTVYLTDTAKYYLQEYLNTRTDELDILFTCNKGEPRPVKKNSIERLFARLSDEAGVDRIHPHRFRVKRICTIVNRTDNIVIAQAIAGHSNISTTERYYRKNQEHVKSEFFRIS
ncbi:MAG: tyrosine-type recombinase/integrase, partial [Firmicutes bacterium]|nr:tyrosine-type recombinase/integrase [Candidatus Colivicinus equi]